MIRSVISATHDHISEIPEAKRGLSPSYLFDLFMPQIFFGPLRSSEASFLFVPKSRHKHVQAFAVRAQSRVYLLNQIFVPQVLLSLCFNLIFCVSVCVLFQIKSNFTLLFVLYKSYICLKTLFNLYNTQHIMYIIVPYFYIFCCKAFCATG